MQTLPLQTILRHTAPIKCNASQKRAMFYILDAIPEHAGSLYQANPAAHNRPEHMGAILPLASLRKGVRYTASSLCPKKRRKKKLKFKVVCPRLTARGHRLKQKANPVKILGNNNCLNIPGTVFFARKLSTCIYLHICPT